MSVQMEAMGDMEKADIKTRVASADESNGRTRARAALSFRQHCQGKLYAARVLMEFMRYFSNWREVWSAYRSGAELPDLHLRAGFTVTHAPGDAAHLIFREIFEDHAYTGDGFYEPRPDHTVLDMGANIGLFAIFLQSFAPGARVHCFEPAASTRGRLEKNISINQLEPYVSVYPFAVSDSNGAAYLSQNASSIQRTLVRGGTTPAAADVVESITLARAIELSGAREIDLLKMDIEGAEIETVLGSPPEIWESVKRVSMEYHGSLRPRCLEELTSALSDRGFRNIRSIPSRASCTEGILRASR